LDCATLELRRPHTFGLLRGITSDSTDDGVLLASDAVGGALDVALSLSSLVLGLALGVLLLSGALPFSRADDIADGLDDVALGGVELTRGLAVYAQGNVSDRPLGGGNTSTYEGSF